MAASPTTATSRFWHPFADMGAVSQRELLIERGEGVWVYDADDRRYLDGTASLWYANIGHGNREVAERVAAQMARLEAYSTFGDFGNRPANELCVFPDKVARRTRVERAVFAPASNAAHVVPASQVDIRRPHEGAARTPVPPASGSRPTPTRASGSAG